MTARRRSTSGRSELARLLIDLRHTAGLSQTDAGALIKLSQDRVSRAERGDDRYPLSVDEARAYAAALNASPAQEKRLADLTAAALARAEATATRQVALIRRGVDIQRRTRDLVEGAVEVWSLQNRVMLGNFQARSYTEAMLALSGGDPGPEWWTARDERVALVDDPTRRWRQVLSEAALRRGIGSRRVMADQCDYLIEASHRPNVALGVIPLDRVLPLWPEPSFHLYFRHDGAGTMETSTPLGAMFPDDPDEIAVARESFEQHAAPEVCLWGDDFREMCQAAARRWRRQR